MNLQIVRVVPGSFKATIHSLTCGQQWNHITRYDVGSFGRLCLLPHSPTSPFSPSTSKTFLIETITLVNENEEEINSRRNEMEEKKNNEKFKWHFSFIYYYCLSIADDINVCLSVRCEWNTTSTFLLWKLNFLTTIAATASHRSMMNDDMTEKVVMNIISSRLLTDEQWTHAPLTLCELNKWTKMLITLSVASANDRSTTHSDSTMWKQHISDNTD